MQKLRPRSELLDQKPNFDTSVGLHPFSIKRESKYCKTVTLPARLSLPPVLAAGAVSRATCREVAQT